MSVVCFTTFNAVPPLTCAVCVQVGGHRLPVLDHCTITGVLTSRVDSRDVKVGQVSIQLKGKHLFHEADLELTYGKKYGLIGANGSGKTTLLAAIAAREIPIPEHVDIWHLHEEAAPSDRCRIPLTAPSAGPLNRGMPPSDQHGGRLPVRPDTNPPPPPSGPLTL